MPLVLLRVCAFTFAERYNRNVPAGARACFGAPRTFTSRVSASRRSWSTVLLTGQASSSGAAGLRSRPA